MLIYAKDGKDENSFEKQIRNLVVATLHARAAITWIVQVFGRIIIPNVNPTTKVVTHGGNKTICEPMDNRKNYSIYQYFAVSSGVITGVDLGNNFKMNDHK